MIRTISIRNWQSLRQVDLDLAGLTVIVGPSSSGKTSLMRALRLLSSNTRGAGAHITRGQKNAVVTVVTDTHKVTLERTASTSVYRLVDLATGKQEDYPKLASGVPEEITAALGIAPVPAGGTSLNFAGQFDPPYLLGREDTGSAIARVLGELTNVTTVFKAVAEGNRRRNSAAATLRTRQQDLARVREQIQAFADLPARLAACGRAEQAMARADDLAARAGRLRQATDSLRAAESVLERSRQLPTVPADAALLQAAARREAFTALLRNWIAGNNAVTAATAAADQAAADEAALHTQLHDTLVAAGTCPTCERPI